MKSYHATMKTWVQVFAACLLSISVMAELRTPENIPITFYGKVVDQNGNPLAGAKISLDVVVSHFSENGTEQKPLTLESDSDGDFTVTGFIAHGIDRISVEKAGYELSPKTKRGYVFTVVPDYNPDPSNPVLFKMWKQQGAQSLIHSAWHHQIACDSTPVQFNLLDGSQVADGNLKIACTLTPSTVQRGGRSLSDYKIEIVINGGGLQAIKDEFTYLAPETGYLPSLTIERKAGDPEWVAQVKQEFYIRTAEGEYGRLTVDWYAWQAPPTHLEWDCFINPTGSRNLEYDKKAEMRKHLSRSNEIPSP